jgi:putative endonuclease
MWFVYLLKCKDDSVYTGITNNVENRMKVHASGKGSKYVASKGFDELLFVISAEDKSSALKIEYAVKQRNKFDKMQFFREHEDRVY